MSYPLLCEWDSLSFSHFYRMQFFFFFLSHVCIAYATHICMHVFCDMRACCVALLYFLRFLLCYTHNTYCPSLYLAFARSCSIVLYIALYKRMHIIYVCFCSGGGGGGAAAAFETIYRFAFLLNRIRCVRVSESKQQTVRGTLLMIRVHALWIHCIACLYTNTNT